MTFFYDLNKKLQQVLDTPKSEHKQLHESAVAEAGYSAKDARAGKDIGKPGKNFEKIAKGAAERYGSKAAGERVAGAVLNKLRHPKEDVEEGFVDTVKSAAQKALDVLGHGDDEAMIRDLQKKAGVPQTGKVPPQQKPAQTNPTTAGQQPMSEDDMEEGNKFTGNLAKARAAGKKQADLDGDGDMERVREAKKSKPDFLDLDKDGDRKEPMKSAARKIAGKRYGGSAQKDDEPEVKPEVPRGRGRPKKSTDTEQGAELKPDWSAFGIGKVKLPAHKGAVTKHKLSDKEPKKVKEDSDSQLQDAIKMLKKAGYTVTKDDVKERKLSSSEKEEREDIVKGMKKSKGDFEKRYGKRGEEVMYATATKMAKERGPGNPDRKKKEKTEETTVAGSVAPAAAAPKSSKGGMTFGKGIYDSLNREVESMISESMNVSVNMTVDADGKPNKSITVSADGESADHLAQLLNLAGVPSHEETCDTCGQTPCGCEEEMVDENSPDWPTDSEVTGEDDPELRRWAGGLNGPKSTGQTVGAPFNRQDQRQGVMSESNDLGLKLYQEYTKYKAK